MFDVVQFTDIGVIAAEDLHSSVQVGPVITKDGPRHARAPTVAFRQAATVFLFELFIGSSAIGSMSSWHSGRPTGRSDSRIPRITRHLVVPIWIE